MQESFPAVLQQVFTTGESLECESLFSLMRWRIMGGQKRTIADLISGFQSI